MTPLICLVVSLHDGDGPWRCSTGEKLRIAAVQAADFESAPPCRQRRPGYVCDDRLAAAARDSAAAMYRGRALSCRRLERSYKRIVADCTYRGESVSCALVRAGVGQWEGDWARRYKMRRCAP